MKRKSLVFTLALCMVMLITSFNVSALTYGEEWNDYSSSSSRNYSDVPKSHWAYENIQRTTEKNWFGGYPDGTFRPEATITRAEALKVFVVFLGLELENVTKSSYYDVKVSDWYSPYVEAGKELFPEKSNIQGKTSFQPNMPITREDTIYAIVTALGYNNDIEFVDQSVLNMFSDKNSISTNIKPYASIAVNVGLVSGHSNGTIGGQDPLTRAEFATLLYRASFVGFNSKPQAKLQSVTIDSSSRKILKVGESFKVTATAKYSDGGEESYTNINPYNEDDNGVVNINKNKITAVKAGNCEIKFEDEHLKNQSIIIIVEEEQEDSKDEFEIKTQKDDGEGNFDEGAKPVIKDETIIHDKTEIINSEDLEYADIEFSTESQEGTTYETAIELNLKEGQNIIERESAKLNVEYWYKINMKKPGTLVIEYTNVYSPQNLSFTPTLYSSDGKKELLMESRNYYYSPAANWVKNTNLQAGTYFLMVSDNSSPKSKNCTYDDYKMHINIEYDEHGGSSTDSGDTQKSAKIIDITMEYKESIGYQNEKGKIDAEDWFCFEVNETSGFEVIYDNVYANLYLYYVRKDNGSLSEMMGKDWRGERTIVLNPGKYYLRIERDFEKNQPCYYSFYFKPRKIY